VSTGSTSHTGRPFFRPGGCNEVTITTTTTTMYGPRYYPSNNSMPYGGGGSGGYGRFGGLGGGDRGGPAMGGGPSYLNDNAGRQQYHHPSPPQPQPQDLYHPYPYQHQHTLSPPPPMLPRMMSPSDNDTGMDNSDEIETWWDISLSGPNAHRGATPLAIRCMRTQGWDEHFAARALLGYRQFMELKSVMDDWNDTKLWAPRPIRCVWEEHVLDNRNYADDCMLLFGNYVGYDPDATSQVPSRVVAARIETTKIAVQARYGPDSLLRDPEVWNWKGSEAGGGGGGGEQHRRRQSHHHPSRHNAYNKAADDNGDYDRLYSGMNRAQSPTSERGRIPVASPVGGGSANRVDRSWSPQPQRERYRTGVRSVSPPKARERYGDVRSVSPPQSRERGQPHPRDRYASIGKTRTRSLSPVRERSRNGNADRSIYTATSSAIDDGDDDPSMTSSPLHYQVPKRSRIRSPSPVSDARQQRPSRSPSPVRSNSPTGRRSYIGNDRNYADIPNNHSDNSNGSRGIDRTLTPPRSRSPVRDQRPGSPLNTPKSPGGTSIGSKDLVTVSVKDTGTGKLTYFSMRYRNTLMNTVFTVYAARKGLDASKLKFSFNGRLLNGMETAASLGMKEKDQIDVMDLK